MHKIKETKSTITELMAVPDDQKAELIDGVIYMMAAAAAKHSMVCNMLAANITMHLENKEKGPRDPDNWRILTEAWTDYNEHNSFVHDIAGFSWRDLPSLPDSGPIMAKPIWVCEIISPANWKNDTHRKRVVLEHYRVPYYWLVDPVRKTIQVFELPQNSRHYQIVESVDDADGQVNLAPFTDLTLDLMRIFNY